MVYKIQTMDRQKKLPRSKKVRRIEKFLEYCVGKDVLNVGMGGYIDDADQTEAWKNSGLENTLHFRAVKVSNRVTGIDINQHALDSMARICPGEYICANVMEHTFGDKVSEKYDVILFGEVLEHLDSFSSALTNLRHALKEDGIIVISTPNAFAIDRFFKMFFSYEAVHLEHTCYFSYLTLKRLMQMNKLGIQDFFYHQEHRKNYKNLMHRMSDTFLNVWSTIFPQFSEGLIITVRRA